MEQFSFTARYMVRCRHSGCRLHEITTYDRAKVIADTHTLTSGHREVSIVSYSIPTGPLLAT